MHNLISSRRDSDVYQLVFTEVLKPEKEKWQLKKQLKENIKLEFI